MKKIHIQNFLAFQAWKKLIFYEKIGILNAIYYDDQKPSDNQKNMENKLKKWNVQNFFIENF